MGSAPPPPATHKYAIYTFRSFLDINEVILERACSKSYYYLPTRDISSGILRYPSS